MIRSAAAEPAAVPVPIRRCDPAPQLRRLRGEVMAAIERVLDSGRYVLGDELAAFEAEMAGFVGVAHGVGVGSGTDALALALTAAGLHPGDEVIVPPFGPTPTPAAVLQAGGRPVFADGEPETGLLDVADAARRAGPRARFAVPVHLFGRVCDMKAVGELAARHRLRVIEDAAQAHGSERGGRRAGSFGLAGCFSFYPTKNLGGVGDGGMVVTDRPELADRLRRLRNYGKRDDPFYSATAGVNSRLDELQAAVLRVKLRHFAAHQAERAERAARYRAGLAGTPAALLGDGAAGTTNHHVLAVDCPDRDRLRDRLEAAGVETQTYYPQPLPAMGAYRRFAAGERFPAAERLARRCLALPLYPELPLESVERVIAVVREHYDR
jgi:dTDP-4-amino-4,6-dideoxygalactose transaminase